MRVISVRQPWAWLIVQDHKPVENRTWATTRRGPTLIHAAKGMTHREYDSACATALAADPSIQVPRFEELARGGLIGAAQITDCVSECDSSWFVGPYGFMLCGAEPLPFVPMAGRLGFFEVDLSTLPEEYRTYAARLADGDARPAAGDVTHRYGRREVGT